MSNMLKTSFVRRVRLAPKKPGGLLLTGATVKFFESGQHRRRSIVGAEVGSTGVIPTVFGVMAGAQTVRRFWPREHGARFPSLHTPSERHPPRHT